MRQWIPPQQHEGEARSSRIVCVRPEGAITVVDENADRVGNIVRRDNVGLSIATEITCGYPVRAIACGKPYRHTKVPLLFPGKTPA